MRLLIVLAAALPLTAATDSAAGKLWSDLKVKRDALAGIHQEFDVSRVVKIQGTERTSKSHIIVDMSRGEWREKSVSGAGNRVKIFDGQDVFTMEEDGDEFVRLKRRSKDAIPVPTPYLDTDADWSKAKEIERRDCPLPGEKDSCVLLEARLKQWTRPSSPGGFTRLMDGSARVLVDLENGLVLSMRVVELIQGERVSYKSDTAYSLIHMSYGNGVDASLFKLPATGMREVKQLSEWNAEKMRKHLAGKPAPEIMAVDIEGKRVALAAFKGRTVLLDFWTTWCPPCRADAPALDKLYDKYGDKDLMIVGISVGEDHATVAKFLTDHPHEFPILLTSENDLPPAFQIGVLPTYVVIDRDGIVASAVEGDRGFSDLRKILKKAGLEVE